MRGVVISYNSRIVLGIPYLSFRLEVGIFYPVWVHVEISLMILG